jgi:hypothetical protein
MIKVLMIILLIYFFSCSGDPNQKKEVGVIKIETAVDSSDNEANYISEDEYELKYVVSVSAGYNYDSLRRMAVEVSDFFNFKFDTLSRYFNSTKKKIVLPDNYDDDMWAGEYFFRRFGDDFVSVEMSSAYIDTLTEKNEIARDVFYKDSLKMFVFANMYSSKSQADSLVKLLKPKFQHARSIPTQIYMGCMH